MIERAMAEWLLRFREPCCTSTLMYIHIYYIYIHSYHIYTVCTSHFPILSMKRNKQDAYQCLYPIQEEQSYFIISIILIILYYIITLFVHPILYYNITISIISLNVCRPGLISCLKKKKSGQNEFTDLAKIHPRICKQ